MSAAAQSSSPVDVSIVVTTYDRPRSLERTLRSCLDQTNALKLRLEILVVDNHPTESARSPVQVLAKDCPVPIRYVVEPTRNMSILRNRGFAEARGEYVAIIDDDETAAPDWLDQLVGALVETGADIAVGPRFAQFASGAPPAYDPRGLQFIRDLKLADKSMLALTAPSGKPRYGLGTGNSLFHKRRCFPDPAQAMRPEFGDAGGEDAEMFVRLHRQGRRIVWASRAVVTEAVAAHRTTISYRLLRTRRETQHYVAIFVDAARRPKLVRAILLGKGVIQYAAGVLTTVLSGEFTSKRRIGGRLLMAHGAGKFSFSRPVGYIAEPNEVSRIN